MKKLVAWAIVFMMACFAMYLYGVAIAEDDFTIHANVKFKDKPEEVKEKEWLECLYEASEDELPIRYFELFGDDLTYFMKYKGKVADIKETVIEYAFGKNKELVNVEYFFPVKNNLKVDIQFEDNYDFIRKSLMKKYGNTIDNGSPINALLGRSVKNSIQYSGSKYYNFDCWVLEYKDYNVKIELTRDDHFGTITIDYYMFTNEELYEAMEEIASDKSHSSPSDDL